MIVEVKYQPTGQKKWLEVPIDMLAGKGILKMMKDSTDTVVACIKDNDIPVLFISNKQEFVSMYKKKGASFNCEEMSLILESDVLFTNIEGIFDNSTLIKVQQHSSQQELL